MVCIEGDAPGLSAEDMQASIATLKSIAESLGLEMAQLRERKEGEGLVTEFLLRRTLEYDDFMEVRLELSTFIACQCIIWRNIC